MSRVWEKKREEKEKRKDNAECAEEAQRRKSRFLNTLGMTIRFADRLRFDSFRRVRATIPSRVIHARYSIHQPRWSSSRSRLS